MGWQMQMVWKSTQTVGCGFASCSGPMQQTFVCLYSPVGNVESPGDFTANVLPPGPGNSCMITSISVLTTCA